jgi:hypothetical protein
MTHPFGPLLLVGLIQAETPSELRDREHRHAYFESRAERPSRPERLRSFWRPRAATAPALADCACPA